MHLTASEWLKALFSFHEYHFNGLQNRTWLSVYPIAMHHVLAQSHIVARHGDDWAKVFVL